MDIRNNSLSVNEQTRPMSLSFNYFMDHVINAVKGSGQRDVDIGIAFRMVFRSL